MLRNNIICCNANLLKLNASKTKLMLISNNQQYKEFKRSFEITVECDKTENNENIKYLGMLIDKNLTFKEHATSVINKISKNTNFLGRVAPFLTQWSEITIYNTLILPHFTLAASILYPANKNEIERMQKLQNSPMRIILRVPRDTSIKTMLSTKTMCPHTIPKPGKAACVADSYRTISFFPCLTKTYERMIKFRLESWLYKKSICHMGNMAVKKDLVPKKPSHILYVTYKNLYQKI